MKTLHNDTDFSRTLMNWSSQLSWHRTDHSWGCWRLVTGATQS